MGLIQKACSLAQKHIWFERQAAKDRQMVTKRYSVSAPQHHPPLHTLLWVQIIVWILLFDPPL